MKIKGVIDGLPVDYIGSFEDAVTMLCEMFERAQPLIEEERIKVVASCKDGEVLFLGDKTEMELFKETARVFRDEHQKLAEAVQRSPSDDPIPVRMKELHLNIARALTYRHICAQQMSLQEALRVVVA
ncbi:hypothetical protein KGO95_00390 [Patescibacteria group bacterium]|nr:hypothetical protein [Patescibacteria group bacterium]